MSLINTVNFIYKGGLVKRYHTIDTIKEENVGSHSFVVASLVHLMGGTKEEIVSALFHDLVEQVTGDLPSTLKRAGYDIENIEELENDLFEENYMEVEKTRLVKIADILSGLLTCNREVNLGNTIIKEVLENYRTYLNGLGPFNSREWNVISPVLHIASITIDWRINNVSE